MPLLGPGLERETAGRWPAALILSLLLILLGANLIAQFYPDGRLRMRILPPLEFIVLSPVPEIEVEENNIEEIKEVPEKKSEPIPAPLNSDSLTDAFENLLLEQIDGLWEPAHTTTSGPVFILPSTDLIHQALLDTIRTLIPIGSRLLFAGSWQATRARMPLLIQQDKANRFMANQRSIFNKNWLEDEVLK